MAKDGPIIIIEDDEDDQELLSFMLKELEVKNEVLFFTTCMPVSEKLKEESFKPFFILCDINLPRMSGIEFKKLLEEDPYFHKKHIPFLLFSTSDHQATVDRVYEETNIQGFFQKKAKYEENKALLKLIIDYWDTCLQPQ